MKTIRKTTENLIKLLKSKVHSRAVLVPSIQHFEIKQDSNLILMGPEIMENKARKSLTPVFIEGENKNECIELKVPRYYHLDFTIEVLTNHQAKLLEIQESLSAFFQTNPTIKVNKVGVLPIEEITPIGGLSSVNLSDLCQASGKIRIVDCPVYSGFRKTLKKVIKPLFIFYEKSEDLKWKLKKNELSNKNTHEDFLSFKSVQTTSNS